MGTETGELNKTIIVALVVLIIIGFGAWWYMSQEKAEEAPEPIKTSQDIVDAVTTQKIEVGSNPVQNKIPEVNPVDRANPFKDAYKNPFE